MSPPTLSSATSCYSWLEVQPWLTKAFWSGLACGYWISPPLDFRFPPPLACRDAVSSAKKKSSPYPWIWLTAASLSGFILAFSMVNLLWPNSPSTPNLEYSTPILLWYPVMLLANYLIICPAIDCCYHWTVFVLLLMFYPPVPNTVSGT